MYLGFLQGTVFLGNSKTWLSLISQGELGGNVVNAEEFDPDSKGQGLPARWGMSQTAQLGWARMPLSNTGGPDG